MKTPQLQRGLLILAMTVLLAIVAFCGYKVHTLSAQAEAIRRDYSTTNNVSFGILSVNKWRDLVIASVSREIQDFTLTPAEKDSLEKEVDQLLNSLITKGDSAMNAHKRSIGGKLQQLAYHAFVRKRQLRKMVPGFSRKITDEMLDPSSKRRLKYLARNKLQDLGEDIYDSSKTAEKKTLDSIYQRYHLDSDSAFQQYTDTTLPILEHSTYIYTYITLGVILLVVGLWYLLRKQRHLYVAFYIMSIIIALVLLLVGLTTAMIDIDARINSINFELLGETVSFKNQVIFFQSKSILDVVGILLSTGKYDSIFVGILILVFSILFPITKLLSTGVSLLSRRKWAKNKLIHYFAFQSGKWSMADVTVVAIFMAYIGFNGILQSQMGYLNHQSDAFTSIATNKTSLQPGYIIFVAFVLFGLALSQILKMIMEKKPPASPTSHSPASTATHPG
ncbi:MAG TPA: paraquat-inducible protein A [Puia sp.]|nr:paraquat-inducible protein A [Puia sp.]